MNGAMQEIDRSYREVAGLDERRFYKIFYSHIHPFPILVLGQNPGGETDGTDFVASETYFENWEHDFVRFRSTTSYSLAGPMCDLLSNILATRSINILRQIPVTNVIFRRSRKTESLNVTLTVAAKEAAPFVDRIIGLVNPSCILLISKTAYDLFVRHHCQRRSVTADETSAIFTPNGSEDACISLRAEGFVMAVGRKVPLLMVGHPSKYSNRQVWQSVVLALRSALEQLGLSPIESSSALVEVPRIPEYGTIL